QLAITISVSLLASWLVAVSLIPMLSARMRTPPAVAEKGGVIRRMQDRYARFLRWTLVHRGWSVLGIVLVVAVSFVPMTRTTFDMFGGGERGEIQLYYKWKGGYTLAQMSEEVARIEAFLEDNREQFRITQIYSYFSEGNNAGTMITLDDDIGDVRPVSEAISKALPKSARAEIGVMGSGGQGGGMGQNVSVQLVGDSAAVLREIAADVVPMLEARPELRDVRLEDGNRTDELSVRVDRERAAAFGFSAEQVASFVSMALRGTQLREYRRGESEVPVWVRFSGAQEYGPEHIASFMVRAPDGRQVPLSAMVDFHVAPSASQISRHDRQTALGIRANLEGETTMEQARKAMEAVLGSVSLPAGYGHTFSGSGFEEGQQAQNQML